MIKTTVFLAALIPCTTALAMSSSEKNAIVKELNDQLVSFGCVHVNTDNDAWQVLKVGKKTQEVTENQLTALSKAPFEFLAPVKEKETEGLATHEVVNLPEEDESRRWAKTKLWKLTEAGKAHLSSKCKGFFIAKPIVQNASLTSVSTVDGLRTAWMQFDVSFGDTPIGKALAQDVYQIKIPQRYVYKFQYKDAQWQAVGRKKY